MIIPTLLTKNKDEFTDKLKSVEEHANIVHIDIMNDTLVPGTTFWNPRQIATIKTPTHYELHLMVDHPIATMQSFAHQPNIKRIYFHIESTDDPHKTIEEARYHGWETGIALNPETPAETIKTLLPHVDTILFLAVTPGASGREMHPNTTDKITKFHTTHPNIEIAVDGTVNETTIPQFKQAGVTRFAAGSAIFNSDMPPANTIHKLNTLIG